jgi:hypothetical protein
MDVNSLMRILQVGIGLIMVVTAIFQPQFIYRKLGLGSHRVDRLLFLIGGIILVALGAFGRLPHIG